MPRPVAGVGAPAAQVTVVERMQGYFYSARRTARAPPAAARAPPARRRTDRASVPAPLDLHVDGVSFGRLPRLNASNVEERLRSGKSNPPKVTTFEAFVRNPDAAGSGSHGQYDDSDDEDAAGGAGRGRSDSHGRSRAASSSKHATRACTAQFTAFSRQLRRR